MLETPVHSCSSPVHAATEPRWDADYSDLTTRHLASLDDSQLADVDPLVVNLVVAKDIACLANVDLSKYQQQLNALAEDFRSRYLPYWQQSFDYEPACYRHDERFFRVGMIGQYLRQEIGIHYKPEQRGVGQIRYIDPSDLFLNGVLDTFSGTCGNMTTLALAIAWRMAWSVSLACVHSHYVLRHDDGEFVFNIETTAELDEGFSAPEDEDLIRDYEISAEAITCGSDLRALTPRECLGVYLWQRARHYRDLATEHREPAWLKLAEADLMLSRHLFPAYRQTHRATAFVLAVHADDRFSSLEAGHSSSYVQLAAEARGYREAWKHNQTDGRTATEQDVQDHAIESLAIGSKGMELRC